MKPEKFLSYIFISVIMLILLSISYQVMARGVEKIKSDPADSNMSISADWKKLYPFESESTPIKNTYFTQGGVLVRIYDYAKELFTVYTTRKLMNYNKFIEIAKEYEAVANWNLVYVYEYNPVAKLKDEYLATFTESRDITHDADSTMELSKFCDSLGIKFFYVNAPNKICVSQDEDISGILDFSNQNDDKFLAMLADYGVKYFDLRKNLHEQGMNHHEAFFRTDHHWKPETGLWAAREILKILRDNYNWPVNPEILNPENFDYVIYRDWFLGSHGKKVTLLHTRPDDISLIYPKFATSFHYEVPNLGINTTGDFSIMYNMEEIKTRDYYALNPHGAYDHGGVSVTRIRNLLSDCDKKLLIIHDSFGNCSIPFLSLEIKEIDELDLRSFNGSVKAYIKTERPDIVMIIYYIEELGRTEKPYASESDLRLFDFR